MQSSSRLQKSYSTERSVADVFIHLARQRFTACNGDRYWPKIAIFAYPTCIRCPHWGGGSRWNIAMTIGMEKLEWCGYPTVKNVEDTFILFDRIHKRVGWTPHDGIGRSCTASRSKKLPDSSWDIVPKLIFVIYFGLLWPRSFTSWPPMLIISCVYPTDHLPRSTCANMHQNWFRHLQSVNHHSFSKYRVRKSGNKRMDRLRT